MVCKLCPPVFDNVSYPALHSAESKHDLGHETPPHCLRPAQPPVHASFRDMWRSIPPRLDVIPRSVSSSRPSRRFHALLVLNEPVPSPRLRHTMIAPSQLLARLCFNSRCEAHFATLIPVSNYRIQPQHHESISATDVSGLVSIHLGRNIKSINR